MRLKREVSGLVGEAKFYSTLNARSFCPPKKEREFTPDEYIDKDIFCDDDLKLTPGLSHKYEKKEHLLKPLSAQKRWFSTNFMKDGNFFFNFLQFAVLPILTGTFRNCNIDNNRIPRSHFVSSISVSARNTSSFNLVIISFFPKII